MPPWRGDAPAQGGGFDQDIVKKVQALAVGDYVEVAWEKDEHLRVIMVRPLGPGVAKREARHDEREGKREEEAPNDKVSAAPPAQPTAKAGSVRGTIVSVDPHGRFVLRAADGSEEAFMPHWCGGMPTDGGGLDEEMVQKIAALKPVQQVEVGWEWEERKRCVTLTEAK